MLPSLPYIYIETDNVFDPTSITLTVYDQKEVTLTHDEPLVADETLIIGPSQTLSGSGEIDGDVFISGVFSPGNSPGIVTINGDLTITSSDPDIIDDSYTPPAGSDTVGEIVIEIGGLTPGPGPAGDIDNGYDQIKVTGNVNLGGTLDVVLINNFVPTIGQTFDFLILDPSSTGTISDAFDDATGLFGFGDRNIYFEIVKLDDKLQLQVRQIPGGSDLQFKESLDDDALGKVFSNYFPAFSTSVSVSFEIPNLVSLFGEFSFSKTITETGTLTETEIEVGATGVNAFLGAGYGTADEVGVKVSDANLGLLLFTSYDSADAAVQESPT